MQLILSLTHNNVSFNSLHDLQVKGTVMGTEMVHSYANLFMGNLCEDFLKLEDSINMTSCYEPRP